MCFYLNGATTVAATTKRATTTKKEPPPSSTFCHALITSFRKKYKTFLSRCKQITTPSSSSSSHFTTTSFASFAFHPTTTTSTTCHQRIYQPIPIYPKKMVADFLQHQQQESAQVPLAPAPPVQQAAGIVRNESTSRSKDHQRSIPLKVIGNYALQQSIGKGSMGKVKLGVHNVTGEKVQQIKN